VRHDDRLGDVFKCQVDAVACAEAVAGRAERRHTLLLQAGDDLVEEGAGLRGPVRREPLAEVEFLGIIERGGPCACEKDVRRTPWLRPGRGRRGGSPG
jgi:hypothetical protein